MEGVVGGDDYRDRSTLSTAWSIEAGPIVIVAPVVVGAHVLT